MKSSSHNLPQGKRLEGIVVSNRMQKTVVVRVDRRAKHPRYQKYITISKHYNAHCEELVGVGERVVIQETRPLSKTKRWKIIQRAASARDKDTAGNQTAAPTIQTTTI